MKRTLLAALLLASSLATATLFQGCVVAAVGAGIGAAKYGSAKQKEAYAKYRTDMEKLNLEREKSGLQPTTIMTYEEWAKGKK